MRNLILSGGIFHAFDETSAALARLFAPLGFVSVVTDDVESGLRELAGGGYGLLTVNALRWRMRGEKYDPYRAQWAFSLSAGGRAAIQRHLAAGGGVLGLHTACICFDDWADWPQLLGAGWIWGRSFHPPRGPVAVTIADPTHPLASGLRDFEVTDEVYGDLALATALAPLLRGRALPEGATQPLAWARTVAGGRVVYDALGHDAASLAQPQHARFLCRAAAWSSGRSDAEVREL
jgi:hypothetical protein